MNGQPAIDWLTADFEEGLQRYQRKRRHGDLDHWHGRRPADDPAPLPAGPLRTHARHLRRLPRPGPVVAMKIRITGLSAEVTHTLQASWQTRTPDVIQASGPYPDRGDSRLVRGCIQAQLHPGRGAVP